MKYIIVFIHALAIAIYQLFFGDPVSVAGKFPESAKAGEEFVAEITINKAQVGGFAKFQLDLPQGFTAKEVDSKSGNFTASGTVVKIIWTSVPSDAEFTVKIAISSSPSESGDKQITGKFSYIDNNVKQQVELATATVKIISDGAVASSQPASTDSSATATTTSETPQPFTTPNEPDATITSSRKITALAASENFQVDVFIKKGNIKGFAKLSEKIPAGFVATQISTAGASFDFKDGEAKFIWTSLPAEEGILVSYKLAPKEGDIIQKPAYIEGSQFSYIENDQTKKIDLDKQELAAEGTSSEPVATTTTDANPTPVTTQESTTPEAATSTPTVEPTSMPAEPVTSAATTPKTTNVHYSIQVGAFKNGVNPQALAKQYSLNEAVKTEMHEGYTKCVVGKYNEYKTARNTRETIKGKGVEGAFVTAYNAGKRITVQEALMVSAQKWYK